MMVESAVQLGPMISVIASILGAALPSIIAASSAAAPAAAVAAPAAAAAGAGGALGGAGLAAGAAGAGLGAGAGTAAAAPAIAGLTDLGVSGAANAAGNLSGLSPEIASSLSPEISSLAASEPLPSALGPGNFVLPAGEPLPEAAPSAGLFGTDITSQDLLKAGASSLSKGQGQQQPRDTRLTNTKQTLNTRRAPPAQKQQPQFFGPAGGSGLQQALKRTLQGQQRGRDALFGRTVSTGITR